MAQPGQRFTPTLLQRLLTHPAGLSATLVAFGIAFYLAQEVDLPGGWWVNAALMWPVGVAGVICIQEYQAAKPSG